MPSLNAGPGSTLSAPMGKSSLNLDVQPLVALETHVPLAALPVRAFQDPVHSALAEPGNEGGG